MAVRGDWHCRYVLGGDVFLYREDEHKRAIADHEEVARLRARVVEREAWSSTPHKLTIAVGGFVVGVSVAVGIVALVR